MKLKKLQYDFPKMGGGGWGSKATWNFSENSSVLVAPLVPYWNIHFFLPSPIILRWLSPHWRILCSLEWWSGFVESAWWVRFACVDRVTIICISNFNIFVKSYILWQQNHLNKKSLQSNKLFCFSVSNLWGLLCYGTNISWVSSQRRWSLGKGSIEKKFSFGHCPNYLNPPPPAPNLGNLVLFFRTSKFKIWKSV